MDQILRATTFAALTAGAVMTALPERASAQGYQIDCAILICLSGGWAHPSTECTAARAEFVRRVTPWPIEPPLQIWNCPMGATFRGELTTTDTANMYDVLMDEASPEQSLPVTPFPELIVDLQPAVLRPGGGTAARLPEEFMLQLIQDYSNENGTADVDISSPVFDFVRSIRVYNISINDDRDSAADGGGCSLYATVKRGTYGQQGSFSWSGSRRDAIPAAFGPTRSGCSLQARAVFIDWRDLEGNYGFERVDY